MPDNNRKQSYLSAQAGIEVQAAGVPFWKPDGRSRRVTILAARKPTPAESEPRPIKDRDGKPTGDTVTTLAVFDVEVDGAPHRWDVSSRRALQALDAAIQSLPVDLMVQQKGSGTSTSYVVTVAPPPTPKAAEKRDSPPCTVAGCDEPAGMVWVDSKPYCKNHGRVAEFKRDAAAHAAAEASKPAA